MEKMTAELGAPIESPLELSSWLASSNMHGVFLVAQDKTDRTKMHVVIVNGDNDFLVEAGLCAMQFVEYVKHVLNHENEPASPVKSRADRRRAKRQGRNDSHN